MNKRVLWWLLCVLLSPFVVLLNEQRTERLLSRATLKAPSNDDFNF